MWWYNLRTDSIKKQTNGGLDMIEVKKFFGFAFGGNNDFGEEIALKESKLIDFSSKPTGVGFAIRNNQ